MQKKQCPFLTDYQQTRYKRKAPESDKGHLQKSGVTY